MAAPTITGRIATPASRPARRVPRMDGCPMQPTVEDEGCQGDVMTGIDCPGARWAYELGQSVAVCPFTEYSKHRLFWELGHRGSPFEYPLPVGQSCIGATETVGARRLAGSRPPTASPT
jgi:hypothetical protein